MGQKFHIEDSVELVSSSYEANGYFSGDAGVVIDIREGRFGQDIRVAWNDTGKEDAWMSADDFVEY